jgi:hypothetical protein
MVLDAFLKILDCFVALLLAMTAKIPLTAFLRERLICPSCQSVAVDLTCKSAAFLAPSRPHQEGRMRYRHET